MRVAGRLSHPVPHHRSVPRSRIPTRSRLAGGAGKKLLFSAVATAGVLALLAAGAEMLFRAMVPARRMVNLLHFQRIYTGDEQGLYVPAPGGLVYRMNPTRDGINEWGFGGPSIPIERTPGVPRLAFLGGSTTRSGNKKEYEGSFPYFAGKILEARRGTPVEILNFGVPGWTTRQSLLNLESLGVKFHPDLVVVHHAANDALPEATPGYREDYSHFFKPWGWKSPFPGGVFLMRWSLLYIHLLMIKGIARGDVDDFAHVRVPRNRLTYSDETGFLEGTDRGFRKNMRRIVQVARESGARVLLTTMSVLAPPPAMREHPGMLRAGVREHNQITRTIARSLKVPLCDLVRLVPFPRKDHAGGLVHKIPAANRKLAREIVKAIEEQDLLPSRVPPAAGGPPRGEDAAREAAGGRSSHD